MAENILRGAGVSDLMFGFMDKLLLVSTDSDFSDIKHLQFYRENDYYNNYIILHKLIECEGIQLKTKGYYVVKGGISQELILTMQGCGVDIIHEKASNLLTEYDVACCRGCSYTPVNKELWECIISRRTYTMSYQYQSYNKFSLLWLQEGVVKCIYVDSKEHAIELCSSRGFTLGLLSNPWLVDNKGFIIDLNNK